MLVKIKYAGVHEPELVTGNGSQVYSKVKILEFYPEKVKICVFFGKFTGFIMF